MVAPELDPTYIRWKLQAIVASFLPLQFLCVSLRFYARYLNRRKYGLDDWMIIVSFLGQCVLSGLILGSVAQGGVGYNIAYKAATHPEEITVFFKYLVAIPIWLFPQRQMVICIWILACALIPNSIIGVILLCIVCRPFHMNWASVEMQQQYCHNRRGMFVWFSLPSILTDAIMIVMPLPVVWKLQMSSQLKVALTATFLIGGSGLVASIMRFVGFLDNNSFVNATWNAVVLLAWTNVEPAIYLISACIMMYRPLLEKIFAGSKIVTNNKSTVSGDSWQKRLQRSEAVEMDVRDLGGARRFKRFVDTVDDDETKLVVKHNTRQADPRIDIERA